MLRITINETPQNHVKEGLQFIANGIYIKHLLQERCER